MPADVEKMLEDSQNKQTGERERITPQKKLNQNNAMPETSTDNTATKKRSRDDFMGEMNIGTSAEGPQIEKLL
jgi:hypothetical protein